MLFSLQQINFHSMTEPELSVIFAPDVCDAPAEILQVCAQDLFAASEYSEVTIYI